MNSLDEKIAEILEPQYHDRNGIPHYQRIPEAIAQIHQAYKEAGYTNDIYRKHFNAAFIDGIKQEAGLMTSTEWYDRFVVEMATEPTDRDGSMLAYSVYQVAKRASGIKES